MFTTLPGTDMQHFLPFSSCLFTKDKGSVGDYVEVLKHAALRCNEVSCPCCQDGSVKRHPTIAAKQSPFLRSVLFFASSQSSTGHSAAVWIEILYIYHFLEVLKSTVWFLLVLMKQKVPHSQWLF